MAEPIIHDLDVLRPPPEYVILSGKKIDIGFIPSGLAIAITNESRKLQELAADPGKLKEMDDGGPAAADSFEILAGMCATITSVQHEEMTKAWLLENTNLQQLSVLAAHISAAVNRSMATIQDESLKKKRAARGKSP